MRAQRPVSLHRRVSLCACLALAAGGTARASDFVDGIAAQVGSEIVLASEVERFATPVEKEMREKGAPELEIAKMRAEVLERMIERRLLEQTIRRIEIDASEAEIDAAVAAIAKENGITPEQLKTTVEQQGLAYDAYREQLRGEIQRQKLISAMVQAKVRIDEDELKELYEKRYHDQPTGGEEVHLRHILVPFEADTGEVERDACAEAEAARARVAAGEAFPDVAREVSAVNPDFGGDVGWLHVDSAAPWMVDAIASLRPGETSDVIRTRFGCNVLLLEDRRRFEPLSYEQARPKLHREIFDARMADEYTAFLEKLRDQTYIERKGIYADAAPSLTNPLSPAE